MKKLLLFSGVIYLVQNLKKQKLKNFRGILMKNEVENNERKNAFKQD